MNNQFLRLMQYVAFGLDFLALNAVTILTYVFMYKRDLRSNDEYSQFWLLLNGSWILVCWITKLYSKPFILTFEAFAKKTIQVHLCWVVLVLGYLFLFIRLELSSLYVTFVLVAQLMMLLIGRFAYLVLRSYLRQIHYMMHKIIIVGYNEMAKKLTAIFENEDVQTEIVGFCEEVDKVNELTHYPVIGSIAETIEASRKYGIDEIYSTITPEQNAEIYKLMREADKACIHFRVVPNMSYFVNKPVYINYIKDIPILSLRQEPLSNADNRFKKRLFDIIVSALVIVFVLTWFIPIVGLLIFLESPGPIFFRQLRTGRNNQVFQCLKFRSMRVNAEANLKQAQKNDARLTRIGKFLRKTSLDEFPQFINVFKGDMSIVGPRPHMLRHTDEYSKVVEQYMVRHFLKPGITGWAQVNGYRGEIKKLLQIQRRIEHDIWYIENWSLWLDLKIVMLTFLTLVKGDENAF